MLDIANWTKDKLALQSLGNSMIIYDLYRLIFFIDEILAVYLPHPGLFSYEVQAKIGGICINYMHICYANNAL